MQIPITPIEQKHLRMLSEAGYGWAKWVEKKADIKPDMRRKLIELGRAEEEIVEKAKRFLKSREAKKLIAELKENAA